MDDGHALVCGSGEYATSGWVAGGLSSAHADEQGHDLNAPDMIKHGLDQHVGKRVKAKLEGGQEHDGKVAKVGTHPVRFTELTGLERLDATVKLEKISAGRGKRYRESFLCSHAAGWDKDPMEVCRTHPLAQEGGAG